MRFMSEVEIYRRLMNLAPKDIDTFNRVLDGCYQDRPWCEGYGVSYERLPFDSREREKVRKLVLFQLFPEKIKIVQNLFFYEMQLPRNNKAKRSIDFFLSQFGDTPK